MKSVDYSKNLAKEREYFRDTIQKNKEASDKKVTDTETRTEALREQQKAGYIQDKIELEKNFEKNLDQLKEKSSASAKGESKQIQEQLNKERAAFSRNSREQSTEFDKRLGEIKNSYKTSFESEKEAHDSSRAYETKKHGVQTKNLSEKTEKAIDDYQGRMTEANKELKDDYKTDREKLVRTQADKLTEISKNTTQKNQELGQRLREDIDNSKKLTEENSANQQKYSKEQLKVNQANNEQRINNLSRDFSERTEKVSEKAKLTSERVDQKNTQEKNELERAFNKKLSADKLEKKRQEGTTAEFRAVSQKQSGQRDGSSVEERADELSQRYDVSRAEYEQMISKDRDAFKNSLKKETVEATGRLDKKLAEANQEKILAVTDSREDLERRTNVLSKQNEANNLGKTQELNTTKASSFERLNKVKSEFNQTVSSLEEKHKDSLDNVTKTTQKEKSDFIKKATETQSKELADMRRDFNKVMETTVLDYEQRLHNLSRDNQQLRNTMDMKLSSIMDQADKKLEAQHVIHLAQKEADVLGQQMLIDQKDAQFRKSMQEINVVFQRKMDKMHTDNEAKIRLLTNEYENKLKVLKSESSKELSQGQSSQQAELERLRTNFNNEKTHLISSYEEQLRTMKARNEEKLNQARDFNRLS
jgi:hypothetical protein